jgi:putative aminopeptidase FrvX
VARGIAELVAGRAKSPAELRLVTGLRALDHEQARALVAAAIDAALARMKRYMLAAAEAEGVPVQLATHLFRGSTEASTIHLSRGGILTISVGVPRRYSYSPNETVDLNDVAQAVQLLIRFVQDMPAHVDLGFV